MSLCVVQEQHFVWNSNISLRLAFKYFALLNVQSAASWLLKVSASSAFSAVKIQMPRDARCSNLAIARFKDSITCIPTLIKILGYSLTIGRYIVPNYIIYDYQYKLAFWRTGGYFIPGGLKISVNDFLYWKQLIISKSANLLTDRYSKITS